MTLYKVDFSFADSYGIKVESFLAISLTVRAHSAVTAQHEAYQRIKEMVDNVEAKSVTVSKLGATC